MLPKTTNGATWKIHDALRETTISLRNELPQLEVRLPERRAAPVLQAGLHPADEADEPRRQRERQQRLADGDAASESSRPPRHQQQHDQRRGPCRPGRGGASRPAADAPAWPPRRTARTTGRRATRSNQGCDVAPVRDRLDEVPRVGMHVDPSGRRSAGTARRRSRRSGSANAVDVYSIRGGLADPAAAPGVAHAQAPVDAPQPRRDHERPRRDQDDEQPRRAAAGEICPRPAGVSRITAQADAALARRAALRARRRAAASDRHEDARAPRRAPRRPRRGSPCRPHRAAAPRGRAAASGDRGIARNVMPNAFTKHAAAEPARQGQHAHGERHHQTATAGAGTADAGQERLEQQPLGDEAVERRQRRDGGDADEEVAAPSTACA